MEANFFLNKSFVISGIFEHFCREEIEAMIHLKGGFVKSAISSKTNCLICGEKAGEKKLAKAKELNIKIINEAEFKEIWDKNKTPIYLEDIAWNINGLNIGFEDKENLLQLVFPDIETLNLGLLDLQELPPSICRMYGLKNLYLHCLSKLKTLPKEIGDLWNLEVLKLYRCSNLIFLPTNIAKLEKLKILDLTACRSLKNIPETILDLNNLQELNLDRCDNLKLSGAMILKLKKKVKKLTLPREYESLNKFRHFNENF